ncbi:MAG: nucleotide exchange factor GrpE [Anaerolineales bacterium]|nr:MAG: nucleotide exchange factor GrpE [Anaerolineales bacterium]
MKKTNFSIPLTSFFAGIWAGVVLGHWLLPKQSKHKSQTTPNEPDDFSKTQDDSSLSDENYLELKKLARENNELKKEYQRLLARTSESEQNTQDQERAALFHALETILVQLPVLSERIKAGADIPMDTLLSLVDMIPEKLETLDIKMINTPGEITKFDPILHKPIPSQTGQIPEKGFVKVVIPGFQYKDVVLKHSEVRIQTDGK